MLDVIGFLLFIALIAAVVYKDRKKVKLEGIILMRRTRKGRKMIDKIAKKYHRFFNILAIIGVIAAIPAMIFGVWFMLSNGIDVILGQAQEGVRLVLPWPTAETQLQPGVLLMPWWFWVIGIASVIVPHELMHGLVARLEKVKIKSLGWLIFLFIPGAFVEPDEKQLEKGSRLTKMKIYAAGSFANFLVAGAAWVLGFLVVLSLFNVGGIVPAGVLADYPSAQANLSGAITAIDGTPIRGLEDLSQVLNQTPIGSQITVETAAGSYEITTVKHPQLDKSFIGVTGPYSPYYVSKLNGFGATTTEFLRELFFWIFVLSFGIGLVNLLPIKPLDGGLVFEQLITKRAGKHTGKIVKIVSITVLLLLIFSLVGPIII